MPLVALDLRVKGGRHFRALGTTHKKVVGEVLLETAKFWHRDLLPAHFGPRNKSKYKMADRSKLYLEKIKPHVGVGLGRFRLLMLNDRSQRSLRSLVKFIATSRKVTVRMEAPGYFVTPFIGSWVDPKSGKVRQIRKQPDKVSEVVRVDTEDHNLIEHFARRRLFSVAQLAHQLAAFGD